MKKYVQFIKVLFLISISFFITNSVKTENDTVKIGFLGDFSNVGKIYFDNIFFGAQMVVDDINLSGGLLGRKIELIKGNGEINPKKYSDITRDLIKNKNVVAIFGGNSTPSNLEISEVSRQYQIPFLVSIGNSQSISVEKGHPYVFQFQATSAMETKSFSIFATLMPWKRYAWVGPDYSWGHGIFNDFKRQFKQIDVQITWTTEAWLPVGTTDFRLTIDKIKKGNPEAILIACWGKDAELFVKQAKEKALFNDLPAFSWFTYDMTGEMGITVPEGMWSLARGGPFNYIADKYPYSKKTIESFYEKYNTYPNGYTICCYDSLLAWKQAVLNSGTFDSKIIAKNLKGMKFKSLRGNRHIRAIDGQMDTPIYFGRLVYTDKYPFAVWESVIEIPASKTWLAEKEIFSIRKK